MAQGRLGRGIGRLEERLQVGLVFGAHIQATAQRQELADRQVKRGGFKGVRAGRLYHKAGTFMVGSAFALPGFEVMQCSLQHRQLEEFERRHFQLQHRHRQRAAQAQQGLVDVNVHLVLVFQGLEQ